MSSNRRKRIETYDCFLGMLYLCIVIQERITFKRCHEMEPRKYHIMKQQNPNISR